MRSRHSRNSQAQGARRKRQACLEKAFYCMMMTALMSAQGGDHCNSVIFDERSACIT